MFAKWEIIKVKVPPRCRTETHLDPDGSGRVGGFGLASWTRLDPDLDARQFKLIMEPHPHSCA